MIKKTKTSCTLKSIKNGKTVKVFAKSKNKKGFGPASAKVTYVSGASAYSAVSTVPVVALACATGGTCVVGDRGPGGGIVFYVSANYFSSIGSVCNTTCKYLEVAPSTWQRGIVEDDRRYQWSTDTTTPTGQDRTLQDLPEQEEMPTNALIGQGFHNTSLMKVAGATSQAQAAVLSYAGNVSAGQWFIPSRNELEELCKYARGQVMGDLKVGCFRDLGTFKSTQNVGSDLGGFNTCYWSSTEYVLSMAERIYFENEGCMYDMGNLKDSTAAVRPIRAF